MRSPSGYSALRNEKDFAIDTEKGSPLPRGLNPKEDTFEENDFSLQERFVVDFIPK
jgi:hypothetical protein